MQVLRVAAAALLAGVLTLQQVAAQPLSRVAGPSEFPPSGFAGTQYVDSTGCVFVRAGANGQITWIPRVDRNRNLVCGFAPSVPPASTVRVESARGKPSDAPAARTRMAAPRPAVKAAPGGAMEHGSAKGTGPAVQIVYARPLAAAQTLCPQPPDMAHRYLLSDGRRVTRCGPGDDDPVTYLNGLNATDLTVDDAAPERRQAQRALAADAGGYRVVWSKGALAIDKPAPTSAPATKTARVSTQRSPATGAVRPPPRYVQVGVYAEPGNADRAIATLQALGLTVSTARSRSAQRPLRMVLAGPFVSVEELTMALRLARQSGYRDAFVRP